MRKFIVAVALESDHYNLCTQNALAFQKEASKSFP